VEEHVTRDALLTLIPGDAQVEFGGGWLAVVVPPAPRAGLQGGYAPWRRQRVNRDPRPGQLCSFLRLSLGNYRELVSGI
jgi:hypothetical protein